MSNLTTKELTAVSEQLKSEKLEIKKFRNYSENCTDEVLKQKMSGIADRHQTHYDKLITYLS